MNAFYQQIVGNNSLFSEMIYYCRIIAYTYNSGSILYFNILCEMFYQSKFTER